MEELLSLQQNEIVDQSQVSSQCSHLQLMKDTAESLVKSKKVCQVGILTITTINECVWYLCDTLVCLQHHLSLMIHRKFNQTYSSY